MVLVKFLNWGELDQCCVIEWWLCWCMLDPQDQHECSSGICRCCFMNSNPLGCTSAAVEEGNSLPSHGNACPCDEARSG